MNKRFSQPMKMLIEFTNLFLVSCPNCSGCAEVYIPNNAIGYEGVRTWGITSRRLVCKSCGLIKEVHPRRGPHNDWKFDYELYTNKRPVDWYFGLSLYLQSPCCGNTLWAYNKEHLQYLKEFIGAELRGNGHYYLSVASRLPKWLIDKKHRDEVMKCIHKLEHM
ncbi:hypothetical protein [Brevibacillus sp. SYSU BS000544]|uniref:hypothetical protein n=1 Tax=Brevibacillus sp. SYSU BS000544 TaxID=3416443 RepID=UPI003CE531B2